MFKLIPALVLVTFTSTLLLSQQQSAADKYLNIQTIRLWDGRAPGALGDADEDIPTLTVFSPAYPAPSHPAVIVAPGGSYKFLASIHEGRQVADWFSQRGFTAFVLKYRLGPRYLYPVPLEDAKRAVRLVRSRAQQLGIDPNRIGMIGFSAGGHLTAMSATTADHSQPSAVDTIDRASSRLNFMILGYPWLNAMEPQQKGWISYCSELSIEPSRCKGFEQYSPLRGITAKTPPTFIFHTADDQAVPVRASIEFFQGLHAAGIPAEMHIYEKGHHGVGFADDSPVLGTWSTLLENWLRAQGLE